METVMGEVENGTGFLASPCNASYLVIQPFISLSKKLPFYQHASCIMKPHQSQCSIMTSLYVLISLFNVFSDHD